METDLPTIAKQLRALDKSELKTWLRRGELLTAARGMLADDSTFRTWLRKNGQAKSTAYEAMAAWRHFGSCPDPGRFSKEAMRVLAQSDAAREEALTIASRSRVTTKAARELVAKYAQTSLRIEAAPRKTLSEHQADGYEELFSFDGFTLVVTGPGTPTVSDLLGIAMQFQRTLRDRMTKAAA